jgi:hypothetical protein
MTDSKIQGTPDERRGETLALSVPTMTDELRELQIQQLELMQGTERLISTCSKHTDIGFPEPKTIADITRLIVISDDLLGVSIKFAIVFLEANEAHPLTPEGISGAPRPDRHGAEVLRARKDGDSRAGAQTVISKPKVNL